MGTLEPCGGNINWETTLANSLPPSPRVVETPILRNTPQNSGHVSTKGHARDVHSSCGCDSPNLAPTQVTCDPFI